MTANTAEPDSCAIFIAQFHHAFKFHAACDGGNADRRVAVPIDEQQRVPSAVREIQFRGNHVRPRPPRDKQFLILPNERFRRNQCQRIISRRTMVQQRLADDVVHKQFVDAVAVPIKGGDFCVAPAAFHLALYRAVRPGLMEHRRAVDGKWLGGKIFQRIGGALPEKDIARRVACQQVRQSVAVPIDAAWRNQRVASHWTARHHRATDFAVIARLASFHDGNAADVAVRQQFVLSIQIDIDERQPPCQKRMSQRRMVFQEEVRIPCNRLIAMDFQIQTAHFIQIPLNQQLQLIPLSMDRQRTHRVRFPLQWETRRLQTDVREFSKAQPTVFIALSTRHLESVNRFRSKPFARQIVAAARPHVLQLFVLPRILAIRPAATAFPGDDTEQIRRSISFHIKEMP